jgi:hypothetical protein
MRHTVPIAALAFAALLALSVESGALEARDYSTFRAEIEKAFLNMGLRLEDMRIRPDYVKPDKFRLSLVDSIMMNPADMLERVDGLARRVDNSADVFAIHSTLWEAMDVEARTPRGRRHGLSGVRDVLGKLDHLPPGLGAGIRHYMSNLDRLSHSRDDAISKVMDYAAFLRAEAPSLVTPQAEYENAGPFELNQLEKLEVALADSVLSLSELVDLPALAGMCALSMKSAENLGVALRLTAPAAEEHERYSGRKIDFGGVLCEATGTVAYMGVTPHGPVVIGGHGDNTYIGCFALIADPGGNDRYLLADNQGVNFRLIIDCRGDDVYESTDEAGLAGIMFGTSVLMDMEGDDIYRAGDMSLGAAIYGGALLLDSAGDDIYSGGAFSEGAGFLGVGTMVDGGGNDTYIAGMQSQGFGYVMGSGVILDRDGNDAYYTRMSRKDILRYEDHYLTLSQGCAFGSRPDYSGGIGLLIDSNGNDLYYSDIFGQGVGYWFSVGGLIDRHGHDHYCSYQYAQGSGVHLAFGLLLDEQGNDFYQSKGVSQGCGHDLSLGLLADFSGNDCYTVTDLSQGAGNANGTGIIYDAGGIDAYSSKNKVNVSGYGNYRREFGSIGLQVDLSGEDYYSARGRNDALWESGKYGMGMDMPGEAGPPGGDILTDEIVLVVRDYSPEELFILASRGEPRFRQWRSYAFDRMVEDTTATIGYLRSVLDTKDARERHTIKDILLRIGSSSVPMLCDAVRNGDERAAAEASWILGLIRDPEAFDALMELSQAEAWKQRSNALNALAKLEGLSVRQKEALERRVGKALSDAGEVYYARKDAAYAAGRQGLGGLVPLLVKSLKAGHYSVRYACAEALRDLSGEYEDRIYRELDGSLDGFSGPSLVNALYAAEELSDRLKLALVDSALERPKVREAYAAVAVKRLLGTVLDERGRREREEKLAALLPEDVWEPANLIDGGR